jgi:hypothetical protein
MFPVATSVALCFEATANVAHNPSPKASNTGRYDKQKVMQI